MNKVKLLNKAPHRAFREITFDLNAIKKNICSIKIRDALRLQGNVYESLLSELYFEGCHMMPELLLCIWQKEDALYKSMSIRNRITDPEYQQLFFKIVEKLKKAELSVITKKDLGSKDFCILFYEAIELLGPYSKLLDYVYSALMKKLIGFCNSMAGRERDASEMIARIFLMYGLYKETEGNMSDAILYLQKSLSLVKGHIWPADFKQKYGELLHELVAKKLVAIMLNYGHQIARTQPDEAIELAHKAMLVTVEIGREKNMTLFCTSLLDRVFFLMGKGDFNAAKNFLTQIKPSIVKQNGYEYAHLLVKFYLYQGEMYKHFEQYDAALSSYKKAFHLSHVYERPTLEARTLACMGKIYARKRMTVSNATDCFKRAKTIYTANNDQKRKAQLVYLLAKLKSDEITPQFIDMIKKSGVHYCALYNLRQWKNCCIPFWDNLNKQILAQETEPIYCLRNEN